MSDKGNVIMSPLLSKRLDKMEEKLNRITEDYSNINSKFDKIIEMLIQNSDRWDSNKEEYIKLLQQNKELSQNNMKFLNENRDIYMDKLEKLEKNNLIYDPNASSRITNRYWRAQAAKKAVLNTESKSGIGSVLWPWTSPWNSDSTSNNHDYEAEANK